MTTERRTLGEGERPSRAVVDAIAASEGVGPTEVEPPLYRAIDPEALDDLFSARAKPADEPVLTVRFDYHDYAVTVHRDGETSVSVADPDDATSHGAAPH